jgi:hypothetical protein
VELRFVLRRERVVVDGDAAAARRLAAELAAELDTGRSATDPVPETDDVDDVLWVSRTEGRAFSSAQIAALAKVRPRRVVECWVIDAAGRNYWMEVDGEAPPELAAREREFPMWRLPPRVGDCSAARTRSLWFGIVPTSSAEKDDDGRPMLDDRSIYRMRCFARQQRPPGQEDCPPWLWWSAPTAAYRLAAFYDPQGTKNRRTTITMPDLRTLAARAGQPSGPGGVEIVRPPGSQLRFDPDDGTPKNPSADFGGETSRCTFALELLMIVAMFLFSLFLPVVVFLFQLWWLLLLRFCFPRPDLALQVLATHLSGGGTLGALPQTADPANDANGRPRPDLDLLDEVLETPRTASKLLGADAGLANQRDLGVAFIADLDPAAAAMGADRTPEPVPDDPLCPRDAP